MNVKKETNLDSLMKALKKSPAEKLLKSIEISQLCFKLKASVKKQTNEKS
ncbi:hypothetical protein HZC34_05445 [Candidatus Saganbacteria bacterium]|nr:hypothetical protein [Candidatus Saganbacteria bacterium]